MTEEEHVKKVARAILEALDAPDDPNQPALDAQDDARKSAIFEAGYISSGQRKPKPNRVFPGSARTLDELRFASSLEHCATCNDRLDPASLKLAARGAATWEVAGTCIRCKTERVYHYGAATDVASAGHGAHELGAGASTMLTAAQLYEALADALPLIAPEPARLKPAARQLSSDANRRALVCLHELAKLTDPGVDKAWIAAETARQVDLRAVHDAAA